MRPVHSPSVTNIPILLPWSADWVRTNRLSGPGTHARRVAAPMNVTMISKGITCLPCWLERQQMPYWIIPEPTPRLRRQALEQARGFIHGRPAVSEYLETAPEID